MGFGIIFIGYITLLFFKILPPAMLVGAYLMRRGLAKLSIYGKSFRMSCRLCEALMVYFALYTALWAGTLAGVTRVMSASWFLLVDSVIYYALLLAFHIALYAALEGIARECGYEKGIKKVYFSRVLLTMVYAFSVFTLLLSGFGVAGYFRFAAFICQLVWYVYTIALLYGFYMRVATQEIIDEEEKKIAELDAQIIARRTGKKSGK